MGLSFQKLPVTVTGFLLSLRHVMLGIPSVRVPHSQRNIFAANKGSLFHKIRTRASSCSKNTWILANSCRLKPAIQAKWSA
jgi:hypothetical protein